MTLELIPVLEIGYNVEGVTAPDKYPYWENAKVWDAYHEECFKKVGFKDTLTPYLKGSLFYRLSDITDSNLSKLTIDHTQEMRDGKNEREQACGFSGGYVLRVNGKDKYFPQCCSELCDIKFWENLSSGKKSSHQEHPSPVVRFNKDTIIFDFTTDEFDENFQPTPDEIILSIDRIELIQAVEKVKAELHAFEQRLNRINQDEELNIDNIGGLLIWENENYE
jgi:hypothetical protein